MKATDQRQDKDKHNRLGNDKDKDDKDKEDNDKTKHTQQTG